MMLSAKAYHGLAIFLFALAFCHAKDAPCKESVFTPLPISDNHLMKPDQAGAFCKSQGHSKAGNVKVMTLKELQSYFSNKLKVQKGKSTCSKPGCKAMAAVECLPSATDKPCIPDANGNIGRANEGAGNFGNGNAGSFNIGNKNDGVGNIGNGNQGAGLGGCHLSGSPGQVQTKSGKKVASYPLSIAQFAKQCPSSVETKEVKKTTKKPTKGKKNKKPNKGPKKKPKKPPPVCQPGEYLSEVLNTCSPCVPPFGCSSVGITCTDATAANTQCSSCIGSYYLVGDVCTMCGLQPACIIPDATAACVDHDSNSATPLMKNCQTCNLGHYSDFGICRDCVPIDGCMLLSCADGSSSLCGGCVAGSILVNNECVIPQVGK